MVTKLLRAKSQRQRLAVLFTVLSSASLPESTSYPTLDSMNKLAQRSLSWKLPHINHFVFWKGTSWILFLGRRNTKAFFPRSLLSKLSASCPHIYTRASIIPSQVTERPSMPPNLQVRLAQCSAGRAAHSGMIGEFLALLVKDLLPTFMTDYSCILS